MNLGHTPAPHCRAEPLDDPADAIPALVLAFDHEGRIVRWNRQLEAVTGFRSAEMLGKNARAWIGLGGDRRLDLKDGGHRLVRWHISERARGESCTYAVGIDVTVDRDDLRHTMQAERLAAVGTLAAGLAHGIRNPLNSATLQLQVLRRRVERGQLDREQLMPVIDIVQSEMDRLEGLVHDFLAFAQPKRLELESTPLNELLRELANAARAEARQSRIEIRQHLDSAIGRLELEPARIRQVFSNLVRNALEAMPNGGTLTLRTVPADSGGLVRVDVEDTGVGFPEGAPLFDAFYSTKQRASGLGLAIAYRIVSEHGGFLRAELRRPGSCFSVFLPQLAKA